MSRRWIVPVVIAAVVVFGGGLAFGLVSSRDDEAEEPASTTAAATTTPEATTASTTAPPSSTTAPPATDGSHTTHTGEFFTVEVPADWAATVVDEDPGYSVPATRTTFEGDDGFLTIETQTPLTGTIEGSCQSIFDSVDKAEVLQAPQTDDSLGLPACSFAFRTPGGESRVDILFAHGDRGFAVLAGSTSDFDRARAEAEHAVRTLQRTDA